MTNILSTSRQRCNLMSRSVVYGTNGCASWCSACGNPTSRLDMQSDEGLHHSHNMYLVTIQTRTPSCSCLLSAVEHIQRISARCGLCTTTCFVPPNVML